MTKRLRLHLENYNELIELAGSMSAIGASNTDLMIHITNDVNALVNYSIWGSETLGESEAVLYMLENMAVNDIEPCSNSLNDLRFITGMIACEVLAGMMLVDTFYEYMLDVESLKFYDIGLTRSVAYLKIDLEQMYDLEGKDPDASRLIAGFFQLFRCSGQEGMELRDEIRSIVGGYIGSVI